MADESGAVADDSMPSAMVLGSVPCHGVLPVIAIGRLVELLQYQT
jgi:hypothetical protein